MRNRNVKQNLNGYRKLQKVHGKEMLPAMIKAS